MVDRNLKLLIITIFYTGFASVTYGQQPQNNRITNYLDGKKFYALLGISCAETTVGDFMYSDHCVLVFNKNKVIVKQYSNRNRSYRRKEEPKAKEAAYILKKDTILVAGLQFLPILVDTLNTSGNQPVLIYTTPAFFNPAKARNRIYFTELDKKIKTYFGQSQF